MATAKAVQKIKRKKWIPLRATGLFDNAALGETYTSTPESLIGRRLTANLATLSGDLKQQNISLVFEITHIDDSTGVAELVGYSLSQAAIKRLVSRNIERIDDSIVCKTSDGYGIVIKPLVLTVSSTHKSILQALRKKVLSTLQSEIGNQSYDQFVQAVIAHRLQTSLKKLISKIYPARSVNIKQFAVLSRPKDKPKTASPEKAQTDQSDT